jgi:hypothetical protein
MRNITLGKTIIVDELESVEKGVRGLLGPLKRIAKDQKIDRNTLIIVTIDKEFAYKFKTLLRWCYVVKLKSATANNLSKIAAKVMRCEGYKFEPQVPNVFGENVDGDIRRILVELEMFLKDCSLDRRIMKVEAEEYIRSKKFRSKAETVFDVMENILSDRQKMSMTNQLLEIEKYAFTMPLHLYSSYPNLLKNGKNESEEYECMSSISKALESISHADLLYNGFRSNNAGAFREECNPDPEANVGDYYRIASVLEPIKHISPYLKKDFEFNGKGYSKFYGLKSTLNGQKSSAKRRSGMSALWYSKDRDDWIWLKERIFALLHHPTKWKECVEILYANELPIDVIDELCKIRGVLQNQDAIKGEKEWKGQTKRKFKKLFLEEEPEKQGLKFKDEQPQKRAIQFFPKKSDTIFSK